jgi:hypothetical protein
MPVMCSSGLGESTNRLKAIKAGPTKGENRRFHTSVSVLGVFAPNHLAKIASLVFRAKVTAVLHTKLSSYSHRPATTN